MFDWAPGPVKALLSIAGLVGLAVAIALLARTVGRWLGG